MTAVFRDSLGPIQQAFYDRMVGDETLIGLLWHQIDDDVLTGVYDQPPEEAQHPYVDLGQGIETPRNTLAEAGAEAVQTLHVWSRQRNFAEGLQIVGRLRELFDHQPLTVAGHHLVSVRHEMTQTLRDPDPEIRHLPVRFRITTEQE